MASRRTAGLLVLGSKRDEDGGGGRQIPGWTGQAVLNPAAAAGAYLKVTVCVCACVCNLTYIFILTRTCAFSISFGKCTVCLSAGCHGEAAGAVAASGLSP